MASTAKNLLNLAASKSQDLMNSNLAASLSSNPSFIGVSSSVAGAIYLGKKLRGSRARDSTSSAASDAGSLDDTTSSVADSEDLHFFQEGALSESVSRDQLFMEMEAERAKFEKLKNLAGSLKDRIATLQRDASKNQTLLEEMQKTAAVEKIEKEALASQIADHHTVLEKKDLETRKMEAAMNKKLQEGANQLSELQNSLAEEVAKKDHAVDELQRALANLTTLQGEKSSAESAIKALKSTSEREITRLKKDLDQLRTVSTSAADEKSDLAKELETVTKSGAKKTAALEEENGKMKGQISAAEAQIGKLKGDVSALETENGKAKTENGKLKGQISALEGENGKLKGEMSAREAEKAKAKTENGKLKGETEILRRQIESLERGAHDAALATEREKQTATALHDQLQQKLSVAQKDLTLERDKSEKLKKLADSLAKKTSDASAATSTKSESLLRELEEERARAADLSQKLEGLEKEVFEARRAVAETESSLVQTRRDLEKEISRSLSLEKDVAKSKSDARTESQRAKEWESKCESAAGETAAAQLEIRRLQSALESTQETSRGVSSTLESEVKNLQSKLAESDSNFKITSEKFQRELESTKRETVTIRTDAETEKAAAIEQQQVAEKALAVEKDKSTKLKKLADSLTKQVAELKETLKITQIEIEKLRSEKSVAERLWGEVAAAKKETQVAQEETKKIALESQKEVEIEREHALRAKADLDAALAETAKLSATIKTAERELSAERAAAAKLKSEVASGQEKELRESKAVAEKLKRELEAATSKIAAGEKAAKEIETKLAAVEKELLEEKKVTRKLQIDVDAGKEAVVTAWEMAKKDSSADQLKIRDELAAEKALTQKLKADLERAKSDLTSREKAAKEASAQVINIQRELAVEKSTSQTLKNDLEAAMSAVATRDKTVKETSALFVGLQKDLSNENCVAERLKGEMEKAKVMMQAAQEETKRQQRVALESQKEVEIEREHALRAKVDLDAALAETAKLSATIKTAERELSAERAAAAKLKGEVEAIREEANKEIKAQVSKIQRESDLTESKELRTERDLTAHLQSELTTTAATVDILAKKLLTAELASFEASKIASAKDDEIQNLKVEIGERKREIEALLESLSASNRNAESLTKQLNALEEIERGTLKERETVQQILNGTIMEKELLEKVLEEEREQHHAALAAERSYNIRSPSEKVLSDKLTQTEQRLRAKDEEISNLNARLLHASEALHTSHIEIEHLKSDLSHTVSTASAFSSPNSKRHTAMGEIGIRFAVHAESRRFVVASIAGGTPADFSGEIEIGDVCVAIGGLPTHGMSLDELHSYTEGEIGTRVTLRVSRTWQTKDVCLFNVSVPENVPRRILPRRSSPQKSSSPLQSLLSDVLGIETETSQKNANKVLFYA